MSDDPGRLAPVITWRTALMRGSNCSNCKLVGLGLSLYMNEMGGSAFPSIRTLAGDTSLSERSVREHINGHLHKQGWLRLVERGGTFEGQRKANVWQAVTPPAADAGVPGETQQDPRQETAHPPAPDAAQESIYQSNEKEDLVRCECGEWFPDVNARSDHIECAPGCSAIEGEDWTPASELRVVS